jgi:DNA-binding response OmpR family regulator
MSVTVVLAVGVDPWILMASDPAWKAAGYFVVSAGSVEEAIRHFRAGDFDVVLLGHFIPAEKRERLTFLIRSLGSRVPVASIANDSADCDSFADATLGSDASNLLADIGELMARSAKTSRPRTTAHEMWPKRLRFDIREARAEA